MIALPIFTGKQGFIFSTNGEGKIKRRAALKELLVNRGFSIVGDFSCKGWDTWGIGNFSGGLIREDQMRKIWRKHGYLHGY